MPMDRQQQLEAAAKSAGFPSYAAWAAWDTQRQMHTGGTVAGRGGPPVVVTRPPAGVPAAVPHPAQGGGFMGALNYISSILGSANAK